MAVGGALLMHANKTGMYAAVCDSGIEQSLISAHALIRLSLRLLQVLSSPPDPADEEAMAFYHAQQGFRGKTLTVKRSMAATRRRPAIPKS